MVWRCCFPSAFCPSSLVARVSLGVILRGVVRERRLLPIGRWHAGRREKGCLHGKDRRGRECVFEVGACVMGIGMFMWARTPICGVFFPFFLGSGCVQINRIQNAPFLALQPLLWFGILRIWGNHLKIRKLHSLGPPKASHSVTWPFQSAELCPLRMSPYKEPVSCVSRSLPVPLPSCAPFAEESWYFGTAAPASFLLSVYFWRMTIFAPIRELCGVVPPPCSRQRLPLAGSLHFPHLQTMLLLQEINTGDPYHQGLAQPLPHLWQETIRLWLGADPTTHASSPLSSQKSSGVTQSVPFLKSCGSHMFPLCCSSADTFALTMFSSLSDITLPNYPFFQWSFHRSIHLGTIKWELRKLEFTPWVHLAPLLSPLPAMQNTEAAAVRGASGRGLSPKVQRTLGRSHTECPVFENSHRKPQAEGLSSLAMRRSGTQYSART